MLPLVGQGYNHKIERYLPKGLDEAAVGALVKKRLGALGITDPKQVARPVGPVFQA